MKGFKISEKQKNGASKVCNVIMKYNGKVSYEIPKDTASYEIQNSKG